MKLINLNVEGLIHSEKIFPFLLTESADVVCLQEAAAIHVKFLQENGYSVVFEERCIREQNGVEFIDGLLFATKKPASVSMFCYHKPGLPVETENFNYETERNPTPRHILVGSVSIDGVEFVIGTTHFTWTRDGDVACAAQQEDMQKFLEYAKDLPDHIMCGDFNIPRHYNSMYQELLDVYTDEIPESHKTSLDASFHRLNQDEVKREKLDRYMVDYVFQTKGYLIHNIRLEFGLSDHAAIVAEVGRGK